MELLKIIALVSVPLIFWLYIMPRFIRRAGNELAEKTLAEKNQKEVF